MEIGARVQLDTATNDPDSNMPDADTTYSVSRTTSLAPSDSLVPSKDSTRASTPTQQHVVDERAEPDTPRAPSPEDMNEDVPMVDASPGKEHGLKFPGEFTKSGIPAWPQDDNIEPGVLPATKKNLNEVLSGSEKLAGMSDSDNPYASEPYEPP